jgi:CRISPR-associated protein Cas2
MPLCIIVTRDVEGRYRGFLGSAMLELAPGVYAHPRMSAGVRERLWEVLAGWHGQLRRGSIVMTWADTAAAGALGVKMLGEPPKEVVAHEGVLLVRRALRSDGQAAVSVQDAGSLTTE